MKCRLASWVLTEIMQKRILIVPIALIAMGVVALCVQGCKKEAEPPAGGPQTYMKDPQFLKQLAQKRKELQAIINERAPLVRRMEELVKANNEDSAALEKLPEWKELHAKVVALNAKFEQTRQQQLKLVGKRVAPANKVSRQGEATK